MKTIYGFRRSGKTSRLVELAQEFECEFIVCTQQDVTRVKILTQRAGIDIPVGHIAKNRVMMPKGNYVIDDLDRILGSRLYAMNYVELLNNPNCNIIAVSINIDDRDPNTEFLIR